MTDIANRVGLIYKIVCNDLNITDTYVGSCQAFRARKATHKSACCNSNTIKYNLNVYKFIRANGGWINWSMLQIETVMFREKRELLTKERYWIETLNATLNQVVPTRTHQEYRDTHKEQISQKNKKNYQTNKEQIKKQVKQYYELNKEQALEKNKQYYETNKAQIKEQQKQLITCECHRTIRKYDISRHKNSKIHRQYQQIYDFIYS